MAQQFDQSKQIKELALIIHRALSSAIHRAIQASQMVSRPPRPVAIAAGRRTRLPIQVYWPVPEQPLTCYGIGASTVEARTANWSSTYEPPVTLLRAIAATWRQGGIQAVADAADAMLEMAETIVAEANQLEELETTDHSIQEAWNRVRAIIAMHQLAKEEEVA